MDPKAVENVTRSYGRCIMNQAFFDTFYDILLNSSDRVAGMFAKTDFTRQKELLREGINYAIMHAKDTDAVFALKKLQSIGASHARGRLNVSPDLYPLWVESLIKAVKAHDPQFSSRLEADWKEVIAPTIALLTARY